MKGSRDCRTGRHVRYQLRVTRFEPFYAAAARVADADRLIKELAALAANPPVQPLAGAAVTVKG
jgi:hypothetical protein